MRSLEIEGVSRINDEASYLSTQYAQITSLDAWWSFIDTLVTLNDLLSLAINFQFIQTRIFITWLFPPLSVICFSRSNQAAHCIGMLWGWLCPILGFYYSFGTLISFSGHFLHFTEVPNIIYESCLALSRIICFTVSVINCDIWFGDFPRTTVFAFHWKVRCHVGSSKWSEYRRVHSYSPCDA